MKAVNKNEELVKVAYRLPKEICEKLEKSAIEHRRSINDELIFALQEYFELLLEKRRKQTIARLETTIAELASLQAEVGKYATRRSISVDQANDELGLSELYAKAISDMEAIKNGDDVLIDIEKKIA